MRINESICVNFTLLATVQNDYVWAPNGPSDRYAAATNGPPGHSKRDGNNGFSGPPGHNKWGGGGRGPSGASGPPGLVGSGPPGLNGKRPPRWNKVDPEKPTEGEKLPDPGNGESIHKPRPVGPDDRIPDPNNYPENRQCRYYVRLSSCGMIRKIHFFTNNM